MIRLIVALSLGFASIAGGQGSTATETSDLDPTHLLPPSLVTATIPTLNRAVDWNQNTLLQACNVAYDHALLSGNAILKRDTLRDTSQHLEENPLALLPANAVAIGQQCLAHFRVADMPRHALLFALQLAIAVDLDTVANAIATRILTEPAAYAAVDTQSWHPLIAKGGGGFVIKNGIVYYGPTAPPQVAVLAKLAESYLKRLTPAHIASARTYLDQLDALGSIALNQRVTLRQRLTALAKYAGDLDTQLALDRELAQMLQHAPDSLRVLRANVLSDSAALTYLKIFSHEALTKFVRSVYDAQDTMFGPNQPMLLEIRSHALIGKAAPPVTGDYWFPAPPSGTTLPQPGHISVLAFVRGAHDDWATSAALRRIHQAFPDVAITTVARTMGVFGNQVIADHPEREAELLRHYYVDSLRVPGALCVIRDTFHTVPSGHVIPTASSVWEAYGLDLSVDGSSVFVIDPSGTVIVDAKFSGSELLLRERDVDAFVQAMHDKLTSTSHSQPIPSSKTQ